ncbi:50S ribosomal protein L25/general stress protein Ctc [Pseudoteredinibacter isoporae]|uniref:Large ribosomal subunit protein bL25 n=1 Tax=Pseudoteredinibacter isoporae TaxID=570281 RepID=A0A7X0JR63_9GAMM|nr:50S ribosomal protein L25/general stress protein Ctc [Pseudoteredinibacter isoporae]MBB6520797.1 large subunit ribosomal protein L25 [Pseudoteredinibacter isoporae]
MSNDFKLNAQARDVQGKGASRRLRRLENKVPAIVYGGKKKPANITIAHNELIKQLENEAFYSHIIELDIDGKTENVILKDLQRHPAKALVMHADFLRVSKTKKLKTTVPLHFVNEEACEAVKLQGCTVAHSMTELEITCLPANLPEFIEVDFDGVEAGAVIHISDLKLPKGVESVALSHGADHDLTVAVVNKPKASAADAEEGDASEEEAAE